MDDNAKQLLKHGDYLYGKRTQLLSLWQDIALNFYVERADFTVTRNIGDEFANHLMTSYPLLARRDLGNSFSSMLRRDQWFKIVVKDETDLDAEGKAWLEWATQTQYRAMYDRTAQFERASKEGDHDFAAFGQAVLSVELNKDRSGLLYRCWHPRDVAWCENSDGAIDTQHQKWEPTATQLVKMFGKNVHQKVRQHLEKEPYREIKCRRVVIPAEDYDSYNKDVKGQRYKLPWVSVYFDVENQHVMEETGLVHSPFVIPRWQTVSGSQYAYSPATVAALPDARLIQAMTLVLLDAGEKAADPPMLAVGDAIRSEINLRAGGVTWVDAEYDERLKDVLHPLNIDAKGLPLGYEMAVDVRTMIAEAFFLNKLTLPMQAGDMTATEVSQRVQEYIRQALPLFEPLEKEYNAALCERTFMLLLQNGGFGADIPQSLRGRDVEFKFESPLRKAVEREKGMRFEEAVALVQAAAPVDPSVAANIDFHTALRDALEGIGVPAKWVREEGLAQEQADQIRGQVAAQQMAAVSGAGQAAA